MYKGHCFLYSHVHPKISDRQNRNGNNDRIQWGFFQHAMFDYSTGEYRPAASCSCIWIDKRLPVSPVDSSEIIPKCQSSHAGDFKTHDMENHEESKRF